MQSTKCSYTHFRKTRVHVPILCIFLYWTITAVNISMDTWNIYIYMDHIIPFKSTGSNMAIFEHCSILLLTWFPDIFRVVALQRILPRTVPWNRYLGGKNNATKVYVDVSENSGCFPQIIHGLIGFSIIFTIHFGVPPFTETPNVSWIHITHTHKACILCKHFQHLDTYCI